MKQISVEDIRFMRLRYKHDVALVRVLDELIEYREAEEQSGQDTPTPPRPRNPITIECGGE